MQAQQLTRSEQRCQCWGVEFRGQGFLTAPPGNLLEVYTRDLLAIIDSMSLRGQSPGCRVLAFAKDPLQILLPEHATRLIPACSGQSTSREVFKECLLRPVLQVVQSLRILEGLK